jgi:hypothetical protein
MLAVIVQESIATFLVSNLKAKVLDQERAIVTSASAKVTSSFQVSAVVRS